MEDMNSSGYNFSTVNPAHSHLKIFNIDTPITFFHLKFVW